MSSLYLSNVHCMLFAKQLNNVLPFLFTYPNRFEKLWKITLYVWRFLTKEAIIHTSNMHAYNCLNPRVLWCFIDSHTTSPYFHIDDVNILLYLSCVDTLWNLIVFIMQKKIRYHGRNTNQKFRVEGKLTSQ